MAKDDFLTDENVLLFVTESREMLEEVEPHLVELGQSAADVVDEDVINLIFRLFHSLKGSAGFFQFDSLVKVTHEAETLLDLFRSGQARMESRHTDVLFRACDVAGLLLNQIELTGSDSGIEAQIHEVTAELTETIRREKGEVPAPETPPEPKEAAPPKAAQDIGPEAAPEEIQPPESDAFELVITPDMVEHFIQEADEQLEQVEGALLELEKTPGDEERIGEAFRLLHSFKGNCGFMGYADIEKLSHKAETVLNAVKEGLLAADSSNIPVLLHVVDVLRGSVANLSEGGSGEVENKALFLDLLDDMLPASEKEKPEQEAAPQPEAARAESVRLPIVQPEAAELLRKDPPRTADKAGTASPVKPRAVARQDIRVDLERLDQLINLVGELVIAEIMVTRNPDLAEMELENFERAVTHLDKIVRDLQDIALSVRMIPVLGVFRKMIRLVHDLSAKARKK
ncbi:MAG: Hpt domain-containing protein, partial [Thermodesulfobacteriota bacterium]|nr:Hpt domain-containing protein [Thermodesulfobacteriota bacterium]